MPNEPETIDEVVADLLNPAKLARRPTPAASEVCEAVTRLAMSPEFDTLMSALFDTYWMHPTQDSAEYQLGQQSVVQHIYLLLRQGIEKRHQRGAENGRAEQHPEW